MKASRAKRLDALEPPLRQAVEVELAWAQHRAQHGRPEPRRPRGLLAFSNTKSTRLRWRLAGEQNWRCCHCGKRMHDGDEAASPRLRVTVEHIIPRSMGGTNAHENLAAACLGCNHARGSDITWTPPR